MLFRWFFERKFKLNNGSMDKYRRFLNQYNLNPFASRRQINNYKEKLLRENPAMLHIQPADSEHEDSDSEVHEDATTAETGYVSNRLINMQNNTRYLKATFKSKLKCFRRVTSDGVVTTIQGDLYAPSSTVAAQYGQQLIQQQEQYLRRANSQSYRQNNQNAQQPFGPSAFLPATSTYTNYSSLYSGNY